jgi:hypothetical protein
VSEISQYLVVVGVGSDPKPLEVVVPFGCQGSIAEADPDRPKVVSHFLEMEPRIPGIVAKVRESPDGRCLNLGWELVEMWIEPPILHMAFHGSKLFKIASFLGRPNLIEQLIELA